MTVYAISEQPKCWNLYCVAEKISELVKGFESEDDAVAVATRLAKAAPPSKVVRITLKGKYSVLAEYKPDA